MAYTLAHRGFNVLVVDCDGQRDLTRLFFGNEIELNHDFDYDRFMQHADDPPGAAAEGELPQPITVNDALD